MSALRPDIVVGRNEGTSSSPGGIVEVALLLPDWQMAALERAAHLRGLTTGQMTRRLIRDFLSSAPGPEEPVTSA
jgi:hypothetical protein